MILHLFLWFKLSIFSCFTSPAFGVGNTMFEKIQSFKTKIKFEAVMKEETTAHLSVFEPPNLIDAPGVGTDWPINVGSKKIVDGDIKVHWTLRNGDQHILFELYVSKNGVNNARDFFIEKTCENSRMDCPFDIAPIQISNLAVSNLTKDNKQIVWIFHNTTVSLRTIESAVDIMKLANWVQSHIQDALAKQAKNR